MTGYCVFDCKKIGLKRDLRGINTCKSGDGSYLKKLTSPPKRGGGRSGNFRGSKNQKSGKCHELPRKVIKKSNRTPPHQGLGVLKGKHFKCQTFHEFEKIDIFC